MKVVSRPVPAGLPALYAALQHLSAELASAEAACRAQAEALQRLDAEAVQQQTAALQERLTALAEAEAQRSLCLQQVCQELGVPEPANHSQLLDRLPVAEHPRFARLGEVLRDGAAAVKVSMDLSQALSAQALSFTALQLQALPRGRRKRLNSQA